MVLTVSAMLYDGEGNRASTSHLSKPLGSMILRGGAIKPHRQDSLHHAVHSRSFITTTTTTVPPVRVLFGTKSVHTRTSSRGSKTSAVSSKSCDGGDQGDATRDCHKC